MKRRCGEDTLRFTRTVFLRAIGVRLDRLVGHLLNDLKHPAFRTLILVDRHNFIPSSRGAAPPRTINDIRGITFFRDRKVDTATSELLSVTWTDPIRPKTMGYSVG